MNRAAIIFRSTSKQFDLWTAPPNQDFHAVAILILRGVEAAVAEMKALENGSSFGFAMIRVIEKIDASETVKFCFVSWQPPNVPMAKRARLGLLQGAVANVFEPFHGSMTVADLSELQMVLPLSRPSPRLYCYIVRHSMTRDALHRTPNSNPNSYPNPNPNP
jgi:hypothetical protein